MRAGVVAAAARDGVRAARASRNFPTSANYGRCGAHPRILELQAPHVPHAEREDWGAILIGPLPKSGQVLGPIQPQAECYNPRYPSSQQRTIDESSMLNPTLLLNESLHVSAAVSSGAVLQRLVIAALLGGLIGLEREKKHRPAGLRTNMFMCFGSAMFTMLSMLLAAPGGQDQSRIAAQIITGIGFIGAGSILHSRGGVQGLTTAATIFVVAAIGMCTGAGLMIPAALATALVIFSLLFLGVWEQHIFARPYPAMYQAAAAGTEELYALLDQARGAKHSRLLDVKMSTAQHASQLQFTLEAHADTHRDMQQKLRAEFDTHRIVSFSSSEQE